MVVQNSTRWIPGARGCGSQLYAMLNAASGHAVHCGKLKGTSVRTTSSQYYLVVRLRCASNMVLRSTSPRAAVSDPLPRWNQGVVCRLACESKARAGVNVSSLNHSVRSLRETPRRIYLSHSHKLGMRLPSSCYPLCARCAIGYLGGGRRMVRLRAWGGQAPGCILPLALSIGVTLASFLASKDGVAVARAEGFLMTPLSACADIVNGSTTSSSLASSSSWSLAECTRVWEQWVDSIPQDLRRLYVDRRALWEAGERLRRRGSRCFIELPPLKDGVGSSAIRSIATWMVADEMGCEWVSPVLGNQHAVDDKGTTRYCHTSLTTEETQAVALEQMRMVIWPEACTVVNWLQYFGFSAHAVDLPEDGAVKTIVVSTLAAVFFSFNVSFSGVGVLPQQHPCGIFIGVCDDPSGLRRSFFLPLEGKG